MSVSARARGQLELSHAHSAFCRLNGEHSNARTEDLDIDVDHDEVAEKFWLNLSERQVLFFFFLWFCRTWTKRYLITSQTRVKRVSRIHHRAILIGLAARNRLLLSLSSSSYFLSFSIQKKVLYRLLASVLSVGTSPWQWLRVTSRQQLAVDVNSPWLLQWLASAWNWKRLVTKKEHKEAYGRWLPTMILPYNHV